MATEKKEPKKPYRKPVVRSEKILLVNFFATKGQGCEPFCAGDPWPDA